MKKLLLAAALITVTGCTALQEHQIQQVTALGELHKAQNKVANTSAKVERKAQQKAAAEAQLKQDKEALEQAEKKVESLF